MLFVCYPRCSTCKKALKWLEENQKVFQLRDIKTQNPQKEELKEWHRKSNLPLTRFFNTSGLLYRAQNLKDRLKTMQEDEMLTLLASDGMMVKRPIVVTDNHVLVGFNPETWKASLSKE